MDLYSKAYFGLLFINLVVYILALRKNEPHTSYVLLLLVLWLAASAIAILLINYTSIKNNLFVFHITTPLEYLVLGLLYRRAFINNRVKKLIGFSIPVFILLCIIFGIFIQGLRSHNGYVLIIESIIMIIISLYFLREVMLLQQVEDLPGFPMFWITVGVLFYFTGNLITEGMMNYMIRHDMELAMRIYRFSFTFKYLLFVLLLIGAYCNRKRPLYLKEKKL